MIRKDLIVMSYRSYDITETNIHHEGYTVKINGKYVTPDTARVSAVPFNRRWPGHQRTTDQTEFVNFLSLETDEELNFEVIPREKFDKVVIRPLSLGITPEITNDGRILFTLKKNAYFTIEPWGRHNALHIFADPISDYNMSPHDENVLYYGKGEHFAGTINLKSNQTLFIDEGAVVYADIKAQDAENISICGRGILDNSKNIEKILFEANKENNTTAVNNALRIHTIQLEYCKNIKIEGITIRDSLVYNIRPIGCENLNIENVKIIGNWRYNSDGIDMHNCINVKINNCFIRTFDDSICVKGFDCYYDGDVEEAVNKAMYRNGKSYDIFENVHITNCVIWNDWGKCLEIGAETRAEEIRNIVFENCNIIHVIGEVLDCMNVDYADVHDVIYKDITIEFDDIIPAPSIQATDSSIYTNDNLNFVPPTCSISVCFHPEYSAGGTRRGKNRNITIQNIHLFSKHHTPKIYLTGYDSKYKTENISISDIFLNGNHIDSIDQIELIIGNDVQNVTFNGNVVHE